MGEIVPALEQKVSEHAQITCPATNFHYIRQEEIRQVIKISHAQRKKEASEI